jgi:hypothetical protein
MRGDPDQAYAAELARRGCLTIAPDAIGFEDRNWAGGSNVGWFELSCRLVAGRTLLADLLQEVSPAIDYATSLPGADPAGWDSSGTPTAAGWRCGLRYGTSGSARACPTADAFPIATRARGTPAFRQTLSSPASPARTTSRTCWPPPQPAGISSSPARATCGAGAPQTSALNSPRAPEPRHHTHPARRARVPCRGPGAGLRVSCERARLNGARSCHVCVVQAVAL